MNLNLKTLLSFLQPNVLAQRIIKYYVFKPPVDFCVITTTQSLNSDDSGKAIVRVHPSLISSARNKKGMFVRDSFVKIYNEDNGLVFIGQVKGAGAQYKTMSKTTIAVDYDARVALALSNDAKPNLYLASTGKFEEEYFYTHFETDRGARKAHKTSWTHFRMGTYLAIWLTFVSPVIQDFIG